MNRANPARYTSRLPSRSATRPKNTSVAVLTSRNASRIQPAANASAWKCRTTVGSATLSVLPEMPISTSPRLVTEQTRHA